MVQCISSPPSSIFSVTFWENHFLSIANIAHTFSAAVCVKCQEERIPQREPRWFFLLLPRSKWPFADIWFFFGNHSCLLACLAWLVWMHVLEGEFFSSESSLFWASCSISSMLAWCQFAGAIILSSFERNLKVLHIWSTLPFFCIFLLLSIYWNRKWDDGVTFLFLNMKGLFLSCNSRSFASLSSIFFFWPMTTTVSYYATDFWHEVGVQM